MTWISLPGVRFHRLLQKVEELRAVAGRAAFAVDLPGADVQCGEQVRCAVPDVVGHCHVGECRRPGRIGGVSTARASYKGHRYPVEIINHCVWLYFRFPLSFREVEELMLVRGVVVSYETIRRWCAKFGQAYANQLRRRRPRPGDKWHLDEVFVKINGITGYLWRGSRPARQRLGRVGAVAAKRQSSQAVLP